MPPRANELKFQNIIINSYKEQGGYARKWASEWQVGVQDLICTFPGVGVHLIEVKHRPGWKGVEFKNPMEKAQVSVAQHYRDAGGLVFGAVVVGGPNALGTTLYFFDPCSGRVVLEGGSKYVLGKGYDLKGLVEEWTKN